MEVLLVDLGNSRLKWRLIAGERREDGALPLADGERFLDRLAGRAPFLSLWLASVARGLRARRLASRLLALPFARCERVRVQSQWAGLRLGYREPGELGVDRWLALLAARPFAPCAVALAGSGLTLDGLDADARHFPGWILPGLAAIEAPLTGAPLRLPRPRPEDRQARGPFARGTGEAIALGGRAALAAAIERFRSHLAERWGFLPPLLLGGGDGEIFAAELAPPVILRPALVLDGLEVLFRESAGR